jgi:hypothetical protein
MAMDVDTALHELALTRPVTESDIVQAYRRMALRFHPDKARNPDEKRWAQRKFIQVQEAYELLKGLPIARINTSPDREEPQETGGESEKQPETSRTCPFCARQIQYGAIKCRFCGQFLEPPDTQQSGHEDPNRSDPIGAFLGFLLLVAMVFSVYFVIQFSAGPEKLSGSPATKQTADPTDPVLALVGAMDADAREFQQTFGRLLAIGYAADGDCFAHFERINRPIHNGQIIRGFEVHVLTNEVTFTKKGREWTYTQLLNHLRDTTQRRAR